MCHTQCLRITNNVSQYLRKKQKSLTIFEIAKNISQCLKLPKNAHNVYKFSKSLKMSENYQKMLTVLKNYQIYLTFLKYPKKSHIFKTTKNVSHCVNIVKKSLTFFK